MLNPCFTEIVVYSIPLLQIVKSMRENVQINTLGEERIRTQPFSPCSPTRELLLRLNEQKHDHTTTQSSVVMPGIKQKHCPGASRVEQRSKALR